MKCSYSFFPFQPIMRLLPGPKTKCCSKFWALARNAFPRCSLGKVELRLSLPGTVSLSLSLAKPVILIRVFVSDGSFYHRLNLFSKWLACFRVTFFYLIRSLCCRSLPVCEENHNYCALAGRRKQSKPKLTKIHVAGSAGPVPTAHRLRSATPPTLARASSNMGDKQQARVGLSFCTNTHNNSCF